MYILQVYEFTLSWPVATYMYLLGYRICLAVTAINSDIITFCGQSTPPSVSQSVKGRSAMNYECP